MLACTGGRTQRKRAIARLGATQSVQMRGHASKQAARRKTVTQAKLQHDAMQRSVDKASLEERGEHDEEQQHQVRRQRRALRGALALRHERCAGERMQRHERKSEREVQTRPRGKSRTARMRRAEKSNSTRITSINTNTAARTNTHSNTSRYSRVQRQGMHAWQRVLVGVPAAAGSTHEQLKCEAPSGSCSAVTG